MQFHYGHYMSDLHSCLVIYGYDILSNKTVFICNNINNYIYTLIITQLHEKKTEKLQ